MTVATIATLGPRGEGIAEIDGRRIHIPFALPGEAVEIEGDHGALSEQTVLSPHRIIPFCPHFGRCGGCQLQHLDPETYTAFKRGLVETALLHAGIAAPVGALIDARGNGRRRTTLHARQSGAGFMAYHSHDLHPLDRCPILVPALANAPAIARAVWAAIGDCDVSLTATLTGLDVEIRAGRKVRSERLTPVAQRFALARLSVAGETLVQAQAPAVRMGKAVVDIPPASFLQATDAAEEALAGLVVGALADLTDIADLFSGLGPFTLRLAEKAKVYSADSDGNAIVALAKAHRNTRGLKAVTTAKRDLFREPLTAIELNRFAGVVFDPPRAGAEAQARELARSKVKLVVAVSCEPKTFARDAKILVDGGYRLDSVTPVDQFAWSSHVEIVGVFRR